MVVDEQRESKRRKVVHELLETERTYVEGLELIHAVRMIFHYSNSSLNCSPAFPDAHYRDSGYPDSTA